MDKIYIFPILLSIISISYSIYLIDYYIKKKNDKYRDYGIVLIVLPIVSLIVLLIAHFKVDILKFLSFFISFINFILIIVTVIDTNL